MLTFEPPHIPANAIDRDELFQKMNDASSVRQMYISAPAGSGKTMAAAIWLRQFRNKKAWMALDEYADNPHRFYLLLLSALCASQKSNHKLRKYLTTIETSAYPFEILIDSLQSLLHNDKMYTLVLDDWHRIHNKQIRDSIPLILKRMPANWTIIVLSRQLPEGDLLDYLLKENMMLMTAEVLKFQPNEIVALYKKWKLKITEQDASRIFFETSGWAIAVNARRIGGKGFAGNGIDLFGSYLDGQIWETFDVQTQTMLVQTSIVETLYIELCNQITGLLDCEERLNLLCAQNAFVFCRGDGTFYAHHIFREYLLAKFNRLDKKTQNHVLGLAGQWFYEKNDYFMAATFFLKTRDSTKVSHCFAMTSNYSISQDIEWRVKFIQEHVFSSIEPCFIDNNLILIGQCAWTHYLCGNAGGFELYMDKLHKSTPHTIDVSRLETYCFISSLDYRIPAYTYMTRVKMLLPTIPQLANASRIIGTASITLNMPHAHRSMRDYSECSDTMDSFLQLSQESIGVLIGKEYKVIEYCVAAGILYERNELDEALKKAQKAVETCHISYSPEIQFCAYMILIYIFHAQNDRNEVNRTEVEIEELIESKNAHYLEPNYRAYLFAKHINARMAHAATEWLNEYNTDEAEPAFYKIYQHFTTARAMLSAGEIDSGIILLKKLARMGELYKRPLDKLQALILLSIAYWSNQEKRHSLSAMEQAVQIAQEHQFYRMFLNEDSSFIVPIVESLARSIRSRKTSNINQAFLSQLHCLAVEKTREHIGPNEKNEEIIVPIKSVRLSKKQTEVLNYMCNYLSYNEIATKMNIEKSTVKTHVRNIFEKMRVNSYEAAILEAKKLELDQ